MTPTLEEPRREFLDEGLFGGDAERQPEIVRRQPIDLVDLGPQLLAPEIAVAAADDPQARDTSLDVGDGCGVFRFLGAEHVEGEAGRLRLARHDMEQVGGRERVRAAVSLTSAARR